MIQMFGDFTGLAYPYDKYAQIFVGEFIFGGMENTTATTLTDVVLMDKRAAIDYDCDTLVAHELAHQWFGDLLTCRDWGQGWLNEGFATYAEYLWKEHHLGRDDAAFERQDFQEQYLREDREQYRRPSPPTCSKLPSTSSITTSTRRAAACSTCSGAPWATTASRRPSTTTSPSTRPDRWRRATWRGPPRATGTQAWTGSSTSG